MVRCPECDARDYARYGFTLVDGEYYYTKIEEVRKCCPIKVKLRSHNSGQIQVDYNGTTYIKSYKDFMTSSWRDFDSY